MRELKTNLLWFSFLFFSVFPPKSTHSEFALAVEAEVLERWRRVKQGSAWCFLSSSHLPWTSAATLHALSTCEYRSTNECCYSFWDLSLHLHEWEGQLFFFCQAPLTFRETHLWSSPLFLYCVTFCPPILLSASIKSQSQGVRTQFCI